MRIIAVVALAVATSAQSAEPADGAVLEALLRHMVNELTTSYAPPEVICLDGYDRAQMPSLLERVGSSVPILANASACPKQEIGSRETRYVAVWLGAAVRISDGEYIVRGRTYRNPTHAAERLFTLRESEGIWTVVKAITQWVS